MAEEEPHQTDGWWKASDGNWYPPELSHGSAEKPSADWWLASDGKYYPPVEEEGQGPRLFSRPQVRRVWERQGRRCNLCRRQLPFDWAQGDHIVPYARGGKTVPENCQALCGSCNLRKGSTPQEVVEQFFEPHRMRPAAAPLRRWQAEALDICLDRMATSPVLVEACPGAGKTRFGLELAYQLMMDGKISRVLVVVPTLGIADGWIAAASRSDPASPSMPLLGPRNWRTVRPILEPWAGAVLTYQSLLFANDMMLAHATDPGHKTLVLFDEVHHASSANGWGTAAQVAFTRAATSVLSLTGTAFRTDRQSIAFVASESGKAKPDFAYSYRDALDDGACRPVEFIQTVGNVTFRNTDGTVHEFDFDDESLNEVGANKRLRAALEHLDEGGLSDFMLRHANDYVTRLRAAGDPDAAGLVVCVDCDHADAVATHMADHLTRGLRPVVACSRTLDPDDPDPQEAITRFKSGHDPWIVAVNMVSEGVDIRRLRCVVYLTNRLTELAFRQIVGRVVRSDQANGVSDHGRVYLVGDKRLAEMAERITGEVEHRAPEMRILTAGSRAPQSLRGDRTSVEFEALDSDGEVGGALDTTGRRADAALIELARSYVLRRGLTNTDPESLALLASENPELLAALKEHTDG